VPVEPELLDLLACPVHGESLRETDKGLACPRGHEYPVIDGVPVFLDERPQTIGIAEHSLRAAKAGAHDDPYFLGTIGIADHERAELSRQLKSAPESGVDPVISLLVGATNGIAYKHLIGTLQDYPIPDIRLPAGNGAILLDIGCNWGRWSIAAARKGYRTIGIDPSLGAVLAAKRLAAKMGLPCRFVVGDARFLPLRPQSVDVVFSYSVIQHFSREDASSAIREVGRVLRQGGRSLIQMPTVFGLRCLYHQARRGFTDGNGFDVRYWTIPALRDLFGKCVGPTSFSVDCFFGIGLQASDLHMMPLPLKVIIGASEALRKTSRWLPQLRYVADSVYVESVKP